MLAVCCMSLFMVGLDNTIVNVGLPAIGRDLHGGISGLQWTVASYTIVLASLLMFSGAIADRIGRRTIFQVGLSLFTLGSWLCSLAPGLGWLIGFRVLQGVGGSMLNPAALGIITNTFTRPAERARAIGVWDGVFGLSMALGPVLGGVLVGAVGWRGIFWANIPVGLAAISLTALFVPDSHAPRSRRADPLGQFLVIVMLGSLAYAIIEGPSHGWYSPEIFGFFAASVAALAVLLAYEPRCAEPMIDLRFFRSVPFAGANLQAVCAIAAMAGFLFMSTLYLQDVRGLSALQAGLTILPMPVVMALCAPLSGRIVAKRGPRIPLIVAGAALTLSSAALSRLNLGTQHDYLIVTYALFGVGAGMVSSPITNGVMSGVPKTQAGMASGMNSSSRQLGQSLGVAIVGSVLAASMRGSMRSGWVHASQAGWWILAGCGYAVLLLGLICTTRWARATAARTPLPHGLGESAPEPPAVGGNRDPRPRRRVAGCQRVLYKVLRRYRPQRFRDGRAFHRRQSEFGERFSDGTCVRQVGQPLPPPGQVTPPLAQEGHEVLGRQFAAAYLRFLEGDEGGRHLAVPRIPVQPPGDLIQQRRPAPKHGTPESDVQRLGPQQRARGRRPSVGQPEQPLAENVPELLQPGPQGSGEGSIRKLVGFAGHRHFRRAYVIEDAKPVFMVDRREKAIKAPRIDKKRAAGDEDILVPAREALCMTRHGIIGIALYAEAHDRILLEQRGCAGQLLQA
jgi:EmrB/QacA subfamily drug resistance transporter